MKKKRQTKRERNFVHKYSQQFNQHKVERVRKKYTRKRKYKNWDDYE